MFCDRFSQTWGQELELDEWMGWFHQLQYIYIYVKLKKQIGRVRRISAEKGNMLVFINHSIEMEGHSGFYRGCNGYVYPGSPVDQTKWLVLGWSMEQGFPILPWGKVWSLDFLGFTIWLYISRAVPPPRIPVNTRIVIFLGSGIPN